MKKKLIITLIVLILIIVAILYIGNPRITLFLKNGPCDILWQRGFDSLDAKMYVYEADGQYGTAMFWKDGMRWVSIIGSSDEYMTAINFVFQDCDDWRNVGAHCLMVISEEYLQEYIEGYVPETSYSDVKIEQSVVESENGTLMVLHGFSYDEAISPRDLAWYALQE